MVGNDGKKSFNKKGRFFDLLMLLSDLPLFAEEERTLVSVMDAGESCRVLVLLVISDSVFVGKPTRFALLSVCFDVNDLSPFIVTEGMPVGREEKSVGSAYRLLLNRWLLPPHVNAAPLVSACCG
jgi:hypothetical protein